MWEKIHGNYAENIIFVNNILILTHQYLIYTWLFLNKLCSFLFKLWRTSKKQENKILYKIYWIEAANSLIQGKKPNNKNI